MRRRSRVLPHSFQSLVNAYRLLGYEMFGRHHGVGHRLRDRECQPRVPTRRAIGGVELAIALHTQKCRIVANLENVSKLRADTEDTRAEAAEEGGLAEIVRNLLIGVAHKADKDLLRQELRHAPIKMKIDTALNLRIGILEIVGEAADAGKFGACRWV
jgi:hypothetical protein